jgi:hypothetical protein
MFFHLKKTTGENWAKTPVKFREEEEGHNYFQFESSIWVVNLGHQFELQSTHAGIPIGIE